MNNKKINKCKIQRYNNILYKLELFLQCFTLIKCKNDWLNEWMKNEWMNKPPKQNKKKNKQTNKQTKNKRNKTKQKEKTNQNMRALTRSSWIQVYQRDQWKSAKIWIFGKYFICLTYFSTRHLQMTTYDNYRIPPSVVEVSSVYQVISRYRVPIHGFRQPNLIEILQFSKFFDTIW